MRLSTKCLSSAKWLKLTASAACLSAGVLMTQAASATTVLIETSLGNIEVNLFDKTTPKTVENFLTYVKANAYTDSFIHRSAPGFVLQAGGYKYTTKIEAIPQNAKVVNEPVYSNVRGTIAMAKVGNDANSATNQWFINLSNENVPNLDKQNGGFTVFGQISASHMEIVDQITKLNRFNMGSPLDSIPLRNYTATDNTNKVPVTNDHFVLIKSITVLNADPDTAVGLNPAKNTLINEKDDDKGGGGGGSTGLFGLMMLGLLALGRKSLLNRK